MRAFVKKCAYFCAVSSNVTKVCSFIFLPRKLSAVQEIFSTFALGDGGLSLYCG